MSGRSATVIMCTWKRIGRLPRTLAYLDAQTIPCKLAIWNNNPENNRTIDAISKTEVGSQIISTVYHSSENLGGIGRFRMVRIMGRLLREVDHVIFIDDDQTFAPNSMEILMSEARPKTIVGQHAFRFKPDSHYWDRLSLEPGEEAHYVATCGMVAPKELFLLHADIIDQCPDRYMMGTEDLWLSYIALVHAGYRLSKSASVFAFDFDDQDSFRKLRHEKSEFLGYLRGLGWKV